MPVSLNDASQVVRLFREAANVLRASLLRRGCCVHLPSRGRLLATGDLHDNPEHLRRILTLARLDASPDHHVVLHEMIHGDRHINGMDFSYRMLARAAELVVQHPQQVHPLLANHELAQMTGKGVSKGAGNSVELFNAALEYVFSDACDDVAQAINLFIRAMPLTLKSESRSAGGVLCAHSLPGDSSMTRFDLDVLERELTDADYAGPNGAAYAMVWGRKRTEGATTEQLAARWNVKLFCLGHEHAETGIEMRGSRIIILNSDHARACALPIDLAAVPSAEEAMMMAVPLSSVS